VAAQWEDHLIWWRPSNQDSKLSSGPQIAKAVDYYTLARAIDAVSFTFKSCAGRLSLNTGFGHVSVSIPKGFIEIFTWKGKLHAEFHSAVKNANAKRILKLGVEAPG
jgi:hypothetical protein